MMYNPYYSYTTIDEVENIGTWMGISAVLAVIGGILIYFLFLDKKKEGKYTGFVAYLYDFLSFKKMWLESILKITYLILTVYITLFSFSFIGRNFLMFLGVLVIGNLVIRLTYEFSLVLLTICRNTTEINTKLTKTQKSKKED